MHGGAWPDPRWAILAGRRGGPFGGRGGGRGFPGFGFGPGGPGFDFRAGRKLSSADLQLLLLALLEEKSRHGYDLIKALEERSNGFYVPSPGVIYPALTYLEEAGETASEAEGSRKLYRLTDTGRATLEKRRAEVDALFAQLEELGRNMARVREAFSREGEGEDFDPRGPRGMLPEIAEGIGELREAIRANRGASRTQKLRIAEILKRAAAAIRALAAGGSDDE
ncbi:Transcriptional regulator, PadR family [Labilithrix luteola]|uniref:Transcriptional regulator, PadR family n=2 Tax=Labilithrix luteola TaxID=1391654 RepID=A0A0K1PP34_9BACT|nr:Transcriptional regulator, PadR family [Labilithrix luteola]